MSKTTDKIPIILDSGEKTIAQAPIIISASRSTDIPAFYSDWFFERLKRGYSAWTNPFNGVTSYVSYANTRFIVFWSKNPLPLLRHLDYLSEKNIGCYIQYTLNDYENEGLEKGVPPLSERINTFKLLVNKLGKGHIIWRFDPMILTDKITISDLINKVKFIGDELKDYTERLVFSFADIQSYYKVKSNLTKNGIKYIEWDEQTMDEFAFLLSKMNKERGWNFTLATCGEKINLEQYGIMHNQCIDDSLIIRFAYKDKTLMDFLRVEIKQNEYFAPSIFDEFETQPQIPKDAINLPSGLYAIKKKNNKDNGQRKFCGCVVSKDIGQYNTCPHLCEYCYANTSKESALNNYRKSKLNIFGETII
ncbi:MAG: DUF1848 domain-containing protein [Barnesiella sp.]|nr:DUF1848 domain-containing protein [Barnesiella sp.]